MSAKEPVDLTEDELNAIWQRLEEDFAKHDVPSEADLMREIEKMNKTAETTAKVEGNLDSPPRLEHPF